MASPYVGPGDEMFERLRRYEGPEVARRAFAQAHGMAYPLTPSERVQGPGLSWSTYAERYYSYDEFQDLPIMELLSLRLRWLEQAAYSAEITAQERARVYDLACA